MLEGNILDTKFYNGLISNKFFLNTEQKKAILEKINQTCFWGNFPFDIDFALEHLNDKVVSRELISAIFYEADKSMYIGFLCIFDLDTLKRNIIDFSKRCKKNLYNTQRMDCIIKNFFDKNHKIEGIREW